VGTEAIWVPLVLTAVSAAAQYRNQQITAHKQDQTLAAQLRAQAEKQHEADAKTADLIRKQAQSTDTQDKAKSLAGYNRELALKSGQATQQLGAKGAVSDAYAKKKEDAALGVTNFGNNLADLTASIDAPVQQRQREQIETIDPYRTDIGLIARRNAGDNFLSNMRLRNIRPNPWLSLTSGLAGSAASAYGAGAFGGANTADAAAGQPWYMAPNTTNSLPNPWVGYPIGSV